MAFLRAGEKRTISKASKQHRERRGFSPAGGCIATHARRHPAAPSRSEASQHGAGRKRGEKETPKSSRPGRASTLQGSHAGALPSQTLLFKEHPQLEKPARGCRSWMQSCSLAPAGRELGAPPTFPTPPAFSGRFKSHRALHFSSEAEQSAPLSPAPRAGDAGSRYLTQTNISSSRQGSFRVSTCQAGPDPLHHLPPEALIGPV